MILGLSRVLFAMARDNAVPNFFAKLNKYSVPHYTILVSALIMIILLIVPFKEIVSMSNAGSLLSYTIANIAAIKLGLDHRNAPEKMLFSKKKFYILPVIGAATTLGLLAFLTRFSIIMLVLTVLIVSSYYFATGKHNRKKKAHNKMENW